MFFHGKQNFHEKISRITNNSNTTFYETESLVVGRWLTALIFFSSDEKRDNCGLTIIVFLSLSIMIIIKRGERRLNSQKQIYCLYDICFFLPFLEAH